MNGIVDDLKNTFRKHNNSVMQLIVINLIIFVVLDVFLWALSPLFGFGNAPHSFIKEQIAVPASVYSLMYRPWSILTYMFAHADVWHILSNMLFLYWFGALIQEYLGSKRVISIYVLGGLVGALSYIIIFNLLPYFHGSVAGSRMVGASAAVYAIVLAAATLMPNYSFHLLLLGPVQIKWIALVYVLLSFRDMPYVNSGGNVAHLGGALIGYIFIIQLKKGNDLGAWITNLLDGIQRIFDRKPKMRVSHNAKKSKVTVNTNAGSAKNSGSAASAGSPTQDEIDAILDKISEGGYESLTKEEKIKLAKFK